MNNTVRSIRRYFRLFYRRLTRPVSATWEFVSNIGSASKDVDYSEGPGLQTAPPVLSVRYPIFLLKQAGSFAIRFVESRQIIPLIKGLPALIAGVGFVLAVLFLTPNSQALLSRTDQRLKAGLSNGQLEDAEWHARRACQLDPGNNHRTFVMAKVFDQLGRENDCRNIMVNLANEDTYVPAIEWLCRSEFEKIKSTGNIDPAKDQQVLHWLSTILAQYPNRIEANVLLGSLHFIRQRYSSAIPALKAAVEASDSILPDVSFSLATAYRNVNETPQAVRHAERAALGFAELLSSQPSDSATLIKCVRSLVMSQQEALAIKRVQEFSIAFPNQQLQWQQLQGEIYAAWSDRLRNERPVTTRNLAEAIERIYQGLAIAPGNPHVLEQLVRITCKKEFDDSELNSRLQIALDSGAAPGIIHFILGSRHLLSDPPNTDEAERHLKIASAHNSTMPGLLNNMAEAIMMEDAPDFDQVLNLVNEAIRILPNQPYFFDTRGKAYLATQQYPEAIADLERALEAPELREAAHLALAEAFRGLGDKQSAHRHMLLSRADHNANKAPE